MRDAFNFKTDFDESSIEVCGANRPSRVALVESISEPTLWNEHGTSLRSKSE